MIPEGWFREILADVLSSGCGPAAPALHRAVSRGLRRPRAGTAGNVAAEEPGFRLATCGRGAIRGVGLRY